MIENLPNEEWRDIRGYEGLYQVSNFARVKSLARDVNTKLGIRHQEEQLIKQNIRSNGYLYVELNKNGVSKKYNVHRLVAEAFIPNPNNLPCVNHKDENKTNNIPDNLEWCTHKYNSNYGTAKNRWGEKHKKPIIQMDMEGNPIREWASAADVDRTWGKRCRGNIVNCLKGQRNSAYGSKWKYKEEG